MRETLEIASTLIVPLGTQVVLRAEIAGPSQSIPKGTVAEVARIPADGDKTSGIEKQTLSAEEHGFYDTQLEQLEQALEAAGEETTLPAETSARPAMSDLLVQLQLAHPGARRTGGGA